MQEDEALIPRGDAALDAEDEVQDWKNLSKTLGSSSKTQAAIPKRGEKEFEPDGTNFQNRALEESRESMYDALSGLRGHSVKQKLTGVWLMGQGECIVVHAKGNYFRDVGVPINIGTKVKGGLILDPLETVYLVERGSMVCYLGNEQYSQWLYNDAQDFDYDTLVMLDLAYLYAVAAESGKFNIDEYQVYSYLKRHGYLILRTEQYRERRSRLQGGSAGHSSEHQVHGLAMTQPGLGNRIGCACNFIKSALRPIIQLARNALSFIRERLVALGVFALPTTHSSHFFTKHYFDYTAVLQALRIPFSAVEEKPTTPTAPFELLFDVWKPTTSFSKKTPPPPDFQLCVVNTELSDFPPLATIQALFHAVNKDEPVKPTEKKPKKKSTLPPTKKELKYQRQLERQAKLDEKIQIRNKYLKARDNKLKFGSSGVGVIIATVNQGILNFVNLSDGDFELKEVAELDSIYPGRDHGIIYGDPGA